MMKKTLLILFLFLVTSNLWAAETLLLDFESATVPASVSSWLNYAKSGSSASTWGAPNPKTDATNSTKGCYKIVKTSDDPYWTGLEVTFTNSITITSSNQYLHVMGYKNSSSRIALTYTPESGSQSSDVWQSNATTGAWIDYVLTIPVGTKLKTLSVKIADDAGDYYFDQIALSDVAGAITRTTVTIDPLQKGQVIEGWGASLCWWANIMGGFSDAKIKTICDWITDPVNGLNMNIFRFNIGGGDDPTHKHMRSDGGDMPGYKASATADYDWNQDANQRKILQQLIASRTAKAGVNDIQLVGFSNSPPYWMTRSGCSAGSTEGTVTNLKADMFDDFADYLTEVTKYYHDKLGITFNYLEPFNEPEANWWKANGGQEGCYFSNTDQINMIRELYTKLQEKAMLSYCGINALDANTIDGGYSALLVYKALAADILPMIDLISVHSYGGNNRTLLANWAKANNKKLWQSESGPLYVGDSYESQVMIMADRTITDLRDMKCTAWCDWQLGGTGGNLNNAWALIMSDYNDNMNPIARNTNYYTRVQFSRFIKAGYTIIGSSEKNSLAAISPDTKELVLVISNSELSAQKYTIDVSKFAQFGKVKQFRTRAQESLGVKNSEERFTITGSSFTYDAQPQSVATFVIPINQNTTHSLKNEMNNGEMYCSGRNLYMNITEVNTVTLSIYNSAGQLVKSKRNIPSKGICQLDLKNGFYLINTNINNRLITKRIAVVN
jgi:O-glycosyl hydrolase